MSNVYGDISRDIHQAFLRVGPAGLQLIYVSTESDN